MMESLMLFLFFAVSTLGGLITGVMLTNIKTNDSGATEFTTMGIFKTLVCGDVEETRVFGIPVYRRVGCVKWAFGMTWKSADHGS